METEIELMLRNINVVASLMPSDKLNTENAVFSVYTPTSIRGAVRYWWGESREANVNRIQSSIRQAKTFIQSILQNEMTASNLQGRMKAVIEMQQCSRMLQSLQQATVGLKNLMQTYRDDASICAKLKILQEEINDFVSATTVVLETSTVRKRVQFDAR